MKRPSPLLQMTLALTGLCGTLVLLADLFFGVFVDPDHRALQLRKGISEALAVQVAVLLQEGDGPALQRTLDNVAQRNPEVRSLAVRRLDGTIVRQAGAHDQHWKGTDTGASTSEQLSVPLHAGGARWGSFEIAYAPPPGHPVMRFLRQPIVMLLLFVAGVGTLVFWLYMRRALQHLDPSAVIPERVQGAFDAMAESVIVLDARGRILLANRAFRAMLGSGPAPTGQPLSDLAWWRGALPAEAVTHPWARAMADRHATFGHTVEVGAGTAEARQLVMNCAPISDPGGDVRGCLVTVTDVSALHRANQALREAMDALNASTEEVRRKNVELERLATRDPLTGCLNRRAFITAYETAFAEARRTGEPLSFVMVDIDHFKSVNDTHGHAVGDRVIQEVAKKLLESSRSTDLVCRYGGEEFCIAVPGLPLQDTLEFAERVRLRIERECGLGVREVPGLRITSSVGVDALGAAVTTPAALIERADQALYRAKRGGRNRVVSFETPNPVAAPSEFAQAFDEQLAAARARGRSLGVVRLVVDPYRARREAEGAESAETAARMVEASVRAVLAPGGVVKRLEDDQFAVILPDSDIGQSVAWAEALRAAVEGAGRAERGERAGALALTITAGVDALAAQAPGAGSLPERAQQALNRARRAGINRVHRFASGADARDAHGHGEESPR